MSLRITCGRHCTSVASASLADVHVFTSAPARSTTVLRILRVSISSSTSSTRRPSRDLYSAAYDSPMSVVVLGATRSVNSGKEAENVAPFPAPSLWASRSLARSRFGDLSVSSLKTPPLKTGGFRAMSSSQFRYRPKMEKIGPWREEASMRKSKFSEIRSLRAWKRSKQYGHDAWRLVWLVTVVTGIQINARVEDIAA